jgi:hypothetical protein
MTWLNAKYRHTIFTVLITAIVVGVCAPLIVDYFKNPSMVLSYQLSPNKLLNASAGALPFTMVGKDGKTIADPATLTITLANSGSSVLKDVDLLTVCRDGALMLSSTILERPLADKLGYKADIDGNVCTTRLPFLNPGETLTVLLFLDRLPAEGSIVVDRKTPGLTLKREGLRPRMTLLDMFGAVTVTVMLAFLVVHVAGLIVGVLRPRARG